MTLQFGVVGHPVKHSLSPAMFEAAFWEYGIDAKYDLYDIEPSDLGNFAENARTEMSGFAVTIPHKLAIRSFLDSVDIHAKAIGAVNTVVNDNGRLKGYNTDWVGAQKALEEYTELEGKNVVILGAGGAAAALTYACVKSGANVTVLNRSFDNAEKLAERFGCEAGRLSDLFQHRAHVLIHTTSIGMWPRIHDSLVHEDYFKRGMVVFDIVYNPMETLLVREAKRAECKIVPGYKMLLYQGEKQFELWFGKKPRTAAMENALLEALAKAH